MRLATFAFAIVFGVATSAVSQEKTRLELLILANSTDDAQAIKDAKELCAADNQKMLEKCQKDGVPPSAPVTKYEIATEKNAKSLFTYRWVELSQAELRSMNLDNAAENDPVRNKLWKEASKHRDRATTLPDPFVGDRRLLHGALIFSRECKAAKLSPQDRDKIKVEYFMLARNPEIDPRTGAAVSVNSEHLVKTWAEPSKLFPALSVQVNAEGAKLMEDLTRKNLPTNPEAGGVKRHLAILVDGKVLVAPAINGVISGGSFMITGNLTEKEIGELAERLKPKQ